MSVHRFYAATIIALLLMLIAGLLRIGNLELSLSVANARASSLDKQLSAQVADSNAALDIAHALATDAELKGYAHGLYDLCMALPLADSAEACLADVAKVYRQAFAQPSPGWRWPIEVSPNPHD